MFRKTFRLAILWLGIAILTGCNQEPDFLSNDQVRLKSIAECESGDCSYFFKYWPSDQSENAAITTPTRLVTTEPYTYGTVSEEVQGLSGVLKYDFRTCGTDGNSELICGVKSSFRMPLKPAQISSTQSHIHSLNPGRYYNAEKHGLRFGGAIHGTHGSSSAIAVSGNYVFIPFYDDFGQVSLTRRHKTNGNSVTIKFPSTFVPCDGDPLKQDSHDEIHVAVSKDGAIHLAYGHHVNRLRYRLSVEGAATVPDVEFDLTLFETPLNPSIMATNRPALDRECTSIPPGERPYLSENDGIISKLTYPTFAQTDDTLLLFWREGLPTNGDIYMSRYLGNGHWSDKFKVIDGSSSEVITVNNKTVTSDSRNAYFEVNTIDNEIHLVWSWREAFDNHYHDVMLAKSYDGGTNWNNVFDVVIASDAADPENDMSILRRSPGIDLLSKHSPYLFLSTVSDSEKDTHIISSELAFPLYGLVFWELEHHIIEGTPNSSNLGEVDSHLMGYYTAQHSKIYIHPETDTLFMPMNNHPEGTVEIFSSQKRTLASDNSVLPGAWKQWDSIYTVDQPYSNALHGTFYDNVLYLLGQRDLNAPMDDSSDLELLELSVDSAP